MAPVPDATHTPKPADYADALHNLGRATGMLDRIERELPAVTTLFQGHEQLRRFLSRQDVQLEGKLRAVETILAESLPFPLVHVLLIMIQAGHIAQLPKMLDAFESNLAGSREHASGEIETALPLSPERLSQLEQEVGRVIGKQVRLHPRISRSMLGGIRVRIGDFVIDGSIDAQLNALHDKLLS